MFLLMSIVQGHPFTIENTMSTKFLKNFSVGCFCHKTVMDLIVIFIVLSGQNNLTLLSYQCVSDKLYKLQVSL